MSQVTGLRRGLLVAPDNCANCYLRKCCERVPPEGSSQARIALVGMHPAYNEVKQNRPFVGQSGELLNMLLKDAGLSRGDVWITNTGLGMVRAMQVQAGIIPVKKVEKQSAFACRGRLLKELAIVRPRVVVALGALPMDVLTDDLHGMTRLVGSLNPVTRDAGFEAIVLPSFHPAHLLRGEQRFYPVVLEVLKKAKRFVYEDPKPLGELFIVDPASATLVADLDKLETLVEDVLRTGERISLDVETTYATARDCDLTVVGFGSETRRIGVAITVRVWVPELQRFVPGWNTIQWRRVNSIIKCLLLGRNPKVAWNYGFDFSVLERFYVIGGTVEDGMILHHILVPDQLHGLAFACHTFLDVPPWKYHFQENEKAGTSIHRSLLVYNAQDCLYTALVIPEIEKRVDMLYGNAA